jgi:hypothetical protein
MRWLARDLSILVPISFFDFGRKSIHQNKKLKIFKYKSNKQLIKISLSGTMKTLLDDLVPSSITKNPVSTKYCQN